MSLQIGDVVVIHGLVNAAQYNGLTGTIIALAGAQDRFSMQLLVNGKKKTLAIKTANLTKFQEEKGRNEEAHGRSGTSNTQNLDVTRYQLRHITVEEQEKTQVHHQNEQGPRAQQWRTKWTRTPRTTVADQMAKDPVHDRGGPDGQDNGQYNGSDGQDNGRVVTKNHVKAEPSTFTKISELDEENLDHYEHIEVEDEIGSDNDSREGKIPDQIDQTTNLHNQSENKNPPNQIFSKDNKDKESSSQDEKHDLPEEMNKEQENIATSEASTLIKTRKIP